MRNNFRAAQREVILSERSEPKDVHLSAGEFRIHKTVY